MNDQEAYKRICQAILVTRQDVAIAEAYLFKTGTPDTGQLIKQFASVMGAVIPGRVIVEDSTIENTIRDVAKALSWHLAAAEAIWSLVHTGLFMVDSQHTGFVLPIVDWSHRGTSSGWRFDDFQTHVPTKIRKAPSALSSGYQPLANPDLYLQELNIPGLDQDVEAALREGVNCFRHGLYLACLAMLGKASEGAWFELGIALVNALPPEEKEYGSKTREILSSRNSSVMKKIEAVIALYDHKQIFKKVVLESGISRMDLRSAEVWADVVRDSRNAVHYGSEPAMQNTYEKVAALLMGAVPYLKSLYRVKEATGRRLAAVAATSEK